jgi:spore germination protein YaaH
MTRRLASLVVALLVTSCAIPLIGNSSPNYGFITITDAGTTLVGGSSDVPPTLNLRLHAAAPFRVEDVTALLDSHALTMLPSGGDLTASTAPMPLGSAHHLEIRISGRAEGISIDFNVISPTRAMLAGHLDPAEGLIVDGVFDDPPDHAGVAHLWTGAQLTWGDANHVRAKWPAGPPAAVQLPATLSTARGSHLLAPISLDLTHIAPATVRRATIPPPPSIGSTTLVAFVVNSAASNTSLAHHQSVLTWIGATGWTAQADGTILGTPDPIAVRRGVAARLPVWPSLGNDTTNPAATSALLHNPAAVSQLINTVVTSAVDGAFPGVNLDFEAMLASDRDAFTGFVRQLASALHAKNEQLVVDIVPHDSGGTNKFSVAYDVANLGAAADLIDLMAYDEHGEGGTPGPVAGLDWDKSVLTATLPSLNPAHTLLGVPLYARTWSGGAGTSAGYSDALASALATPGARVGYDFAAQTPLIAGPDGSSVTYFDDADSLARKIALVHDYHLAGVAAWRLGFEDPGFWSLFG